MGNIHTSGPEEALIRSGCKGTKIRVGTSMWQWWVFEQVERLSLKMMTINVISHDAESSQGVRINVRGVAQVKVHAFKVQEGNVEDRWVLNKDAISTAAQHFLGDSEENITEALRSTFEGFQRQILGTLSVEELFRDREAFSSRVKEIVVGDLENMGFALCSYVVAKVEDTGGYMESLGKEQIALVKRAAEEGRAMNESEARTKVAEYKALGDTAEAVSNREAHIVKNEAKQEVYESDRDLNLLKSSVEKEVSQARQEAKNAGPIEAARQQQQVVREKAKQQQAEEEVKLLISDIKIERSKKEREGLSQAELLKEQNNAKAVKVTASAQAERLRLIGKAEADCIEFNGRAEADVILAKAKAIKEYGHAAVTELIVAKLPQVAKNLAAPLEKTSKMVFINGGNSHPSKSSTSDSSSSTKPPLSQKSNGSKVK